MQHPPGSHFLKFCGSKRSAIALRGIVVLLLGLSGFAEGVQAQTFNFRTWSVRDGLPKPGVYSLHEDQRGYLWIGSEGGGAVRFDGHRFDVWDAANGLGGSHVRCMAEDDRGRMWFGLANGCLSRFDGRQWRTWPEAGQGESIRAIVARGDSLVFATLGDGVHVWREGGQYTLDWDLPSPKARCLLQAGKDSLWIGTDAGLALWHGDSLRTYGILDGVQPRTTLCLSRGKDGQIWAGTSKGALRYDGQAFYLYTMSDGLLHPRVRAIARDDRGNVWLGTQDGLSRFDGGRWTGFTEADGLSYNRVRCLVTDREGNLWIGTYFGGICRYADAAMTHFASGEGLANPVVQALAEGPSGLAVGTWRGMQVYHNGSFGPLIDTLAGLPSNRIVAIAPDGRDSARAGWWMATDEPGLYRVDAQGNATWEPRLQWFAAMDEARGVPDVIHGYRSQIQQLVASPDGRLHVLTDAGRWVSHSHDPRLGAKPDGIPTLFSLPSFEGTEMPQFVALAKPVVLEGGVSTPVHGLDEQGRIWAWSGPPDSLESRLGLAENIAAIPETLMQDGGPTTLAMDARGRILVGGKAEAIWRLDGDTWTKLHGLDMMDAQGSGSLEQHGSSANDVQALVQDPATGDIWASLDHGLLRLRLDGEGRVHDRRHYDETQGHKGSGGLPGAALRDAAGSLWFGGLNGLTRFDPSAERHNNTPARTLITGIYLERGTLAMDADALAGSDPWTGLPENLVLKPRQRDLSFRFTGIALETPEAVRYRWRLNGYDADWVDGGTQQQVRYTNLAPGSYTFEVLAANADGLWLGEPARYRFRIRGHWTQSWWARAGLGLLVLLLLYAVVSMRTAAIRRRAAEQEAKLQAEIDRKTADLDAKNMALEAQTAELKSALSHEEVARERTDEALQHAQTARREAEAALGHAEVARMEAEAARLRAERSEQVKEEFLANMSHEIRTPMNAIVGMTELLLKKDPGEHQLNYLRAVRRSADNLLVILNDILDFSKIEAGKMTLEDIDFSLEDVLQGVRDTFMLKASEKQLELIVERRADTPAWLRGDPVRLNQVLLNLVGNALKFTESGSVTVTCSLKDTGAAEGQNPPPAGETADLAFEVTDTGIGIPEDRLDDIFGSFTQASDDTTRHYGGTGLGLSICQRLVEMQGGQIGVRSRVGQGSTFHFHIPYPVVEGPDQKAGNAAGSEGPVDIGAVRLLLMEDDPFNQMVAVDTLAEYAPEATVEVVGDGQAGVEALEAQAYDVVLLDLGMPVMDGYTAAKTIRGHAEERVRETPLMAMTASVTKSEVDRCFEAGMDDYIAKPFEVDDLLGKIQRLKAGRPEDGPRPAGIVPLWVMAGLLPAALQGALASAVAVPGLQLLQSARSPWTGLWIVVVLILVGFFVARLWVRSLIKREASLRDHVRRKTRELEKETERALRSEKIKEEFLANMSHEIRTPMNAVVGLTNLLLNREPREDQLTYLEGIRHSANHLLAVINDILDFSRIEAGRLPIEPAPFRLSALMQNLETMLGFKTQDKGLELVVEKDPALPDALVGDATRLNQILVNLGGNAVKFTESGHVRIRAVPLPEAPDERVWIRFTVEDSGIGIAAERLPSMFDMFTQASGDITRKFGGTGLGLAISKRLSDAMGGRIEAESTLGKGSTFTVVLPFEADSDAEGHSAAAAAEEAALQLPAGLRILLAEDDLFNQMVAVDTLEANLTEPRIEVAANGAEALDAMRSARFDLVLMDIQMPVMDGKEATQLIRKEEEHAGRNRTPILAMTANVLPADRDRAIASGMDDLIPKPFAVEDLLRRMAAVLPQTSNQSASDGPDSTPDAR